MRAPTRLVTDDYGAQRDVEQCCYVCDRPILAETKGPARLCGDPECLKDFNTWATSHRRNVRRVRLEQLTGQRTCDGCGRTFPLDAEHFRPVRPGYYRRRCIECQRAVKRAWNRTYQKRRKADAERHAAYLADCRLRYWLHNEQGPSRRFRDAAGAYRALSGSRATLALEPLQAWLEAVIEREAPELGRPTTGGHTSLESLAGREGSTLQGVASMLGVDSRAIWRIRNHEHTAVSLGTADTLLTNYGRPVVIHSRDLERRLTEWAQSLPGNGTRILRYMDRAEAVGHLADVAVWSLEDLWPSLGDA